jgi:hypothetical protein
MKRRGTVVPRFLLSVATWVCVLVEDVRLRQG